MKPTPKYVSDLLDTQKSYFKKGATLSVKFRIEQLNKLYNAIVEYEPKIEEALYADLGKNKFEAYTSEIGIILNSITNAKKNTRKKIVLFNTARRHLSVSSLSAILLMK